MASNAWSGLRRWLGLEDSVGIRVHVLLKGRSASGWHDVDETLVLPEGATLGQLLAAADRSGIGLRAAIDDSPHLRAAEQAKHEGVQIKLYAIIYELIDQVKEAMAGLLDPLLKELVVGQAEVRKVFNLSKGGNVAGCAVTSGRLVRGKMRVRRRTNLIYEGVSLTLKRFQDEVNEVRTGMECGIQLDGFDDFQEGDVVECYTTEKVAQKL